ncbi:MAG: hypothetical protein HKP58_12390 [Desulfatitalea sp.]|nr:2-hydroxyglutaryl-CoA dehydratase [Desulfatitalea sp.]NNK01200.1 hypothetical protein [Desulfatitalea sp.]
MLFAGIDIGSSSAQAVLFNGERIVSWASMAARPIPEQSARLVLDAALKKCSASEEDIDFCISTGYGREKISFALDNVSEISCLVKGAFRLNPNTRTLIDIGAQDNKVIRVTADGRLQDFVMNDKCAAGSGRFLERIARTFGLSISELGPLALRADQPAPMQNSCPVYVAFDALSRMAEGWTKASIALSAAHILAKRLIAGSRKFNIEQALCLTGGVAKNEAVVKALEAFLGLPIQPLPVDSQIVGALGAAIFAQDQYDSAVGSRAEINYGMCR